MALLSWSDNYPTLFNFRLSQTAPRSRLGSAASDFENQVFESYEDYLQWYYRWTHNWFECNAFCWTFIAFDTAVYIGHLLLNIRPLHFWASGNILLVLYTYYVTYMSSFALMLLTGQPSYMMAAASTRKIIFGLSLITTTTFMAEGAGVMYNWWKGTAEKYSLASLMELYVMYE